jgi:hypothetical protein
VVINPKNHPGTWWWFGAVSNNHPTQGVMVTSLNMTTRQQRNHMISYDPNILLALTLKNK